MRWSKAALAVIPTRLKPGRNLLSAREIYAARLEATSRLKVRACSLERLCRSPHFPVLFSATQILPEAVAHGLRICRYFASQRRPDQHPDAPSLDTPSCGHHLDRTAVFLQPGQCSVYEGTRRRHQGQDHAWPDAASFVVVPVVCCGHGSCCAGLLGTHSCLGC